MEQEQIEVTPDHLSLGFDIPRQGWVFSVGERQYFLTCDLREQVSDDDLILQLRRSFPDISISHARSLIAQMVR